MVKVDSTATSEDDINNAVTAIRRNGVALKGRIELCRWTGLKIYSIQLQVGLIVIHATIFFSRQYRDQSQTSTLSQVQEQLATVLLLMYQPHLSF